MQLSSCAVNDDGHGEDKHDDEKSHDEDGPACSDFLTMLVRWRCR